MSVDKDRKMARTIENDTPSSSPVPHVDGDPQLNCTRATVPYGEPVVSFA